jgi:NAD-dependent dihydropyrimidine dehydrogenase PreA subunit
MDKTKPKRVRQPLFEKPKVERTLEIVTIPELCKGTSCKICLTFCKNEVLELSTDELNRHGNYFVKVVAEEKCDECLDCYRHCPEFAIFLRKKRPKKSRKDIDKPHEKK